MTKFKSEILATGSTSHKEKAWENNWIATEIFMLVFLTTIAHDVECAEDNLFKGSPVSFKSPIPA